MRLPFPRIRVALATGLLLVAPGAASGGDRDGSRVETTPRFAFHSDLHTNLNDALIVAAAARGDGEPEPFWSGPAEECFEGLSAAARSGWNLAVEHWANVVVPGGWTGPQQAVLRTELARFGFGRDEEERRSLDIARGFLAAAAPAYEACRWPAQDEENRRWIERLTPRLAEHGPAIARRLGTYYRVPLHGLPIRVDLVAAAPPVGANTIWLSPEGGHILISSGVDGEDALEMVFHEASHTLVRPFDPIPRALEEASAELDVPLPRDLWHVILFYTTGEAVRRTLEEAGEPGYVPYLYSYERFGRGAWGRHREALEATWPAYLDGDKSLEEAVRDLLREDRERGRSGSSRLLRPDPATPWRPGPRSSTDREGVTP